MPMPKNTKIDGGYASVSDDPDALDLRAIAEQMTEMGHPMRCSTVRNYLVSGLKKLAAAVAEYCGLPRDDARALRVAKSPEFQSSMRAFLQDDETTSRATRGRRG